MSELKNRIEYASIGLEMGGCVAVGYVLGTSVDGWLGTAPWGMAFFLLCGVGAAVKGLLRVTRRAKREAERVDTAPRPLEVPRSTRYTRYDLVPGGRG